jgi:RNA polymerase sigma factor (sigma-70 family)
MEDPEVVAAIVAGDPAGLAEAYDKYAVPLHSYCRSMLREPADAADAVQDTFLVATAKLHSLRDPAKLRAWLYAVARNECLRRLRAGHALSALEEAAELSTPGEVGVATERAELQELVRAAIEGLNPGERDVIELSLVGELDGDELAAALGVSRNHAHAQLSRARSQLERSLGALIVARTGRQACPVLEAMLTGWDGQMTVLMRKRISRHIERCDVCGERKRQELTPILFTGALPIVALSPGFREQLLRLLTDRSPAGVAQRLTVANRAGPFGPNGFPKPLRPPGGGPWQHVLHHPRAALAGTAAAVIAAVAIVVAIMAGPHHGSPSAGAAGGSTHGASTGTASPRQARGGPPGGGGSVTPSASTPNGTTAPEAFRSSGAPGSASATTNSSPGAGSSSSQPSSSPPSSSQASASAGTLSISTGRLDLVSVNGTATGRFTLTAHGGPVGGYSITVGSALVGHISVAPSSGSLASGASVTITVTSTSLVALAGQLTVNPGGQTITVVLSLGL